MIIQQQIESSIQILNSFQIEKYKEILIHHAKNEYDKALKECKSKGIFENLFYQVLPNFMEDKLAKLKK